MNPRYFFSLFLLAIVLLSAAQSQEAEATRHDVFTIERDADVPELPFPDNPDPLLCGIPQQWLDDDPAWLTGYYQGELFQAEVLLYDSHLRRSVKARVSSGTAIEILLYQANPSLDYYLVRTLEEEPQEGWLPGPFVSFEPLTEN